MRTQNRKAREELAAGQQWLEEEASARTKQQLAHQALVVERAKLVEDTASAQNKQELGCCELDAERSTYDEDAAAAQKELSVAREARAARH
jgi:septal ring factor EnvC (AmiA/AmiB activator)